MSISNVAQVAPTQLEGKAGTILSKLIEYCRANDWAGYDPYDALNSRILVSMPFLDHRIPRLVLTQSLKRSPLNLRRLLQIPKTQNPKALALFLAAFIKLNNQGQSARTEDTAFMVRRLSELRSPGIEYSCWGYSFPWQTRTIVVPSRFPNLVCTTFVADALLDAYEHCGDEQCLDMAISATNYIVNELFWSEGADCGFSYPLPSLRSRVHNANFLAAALLCRAYTHSREEVFLATALKIARYSVRKQHADGSWPYGESSTQQWVDNFHTGYNLIGLRAIGKYANTAEFDESLRRGFQFYRDHFFREDGSVRYFHNRNYPVDVHCVAQSIITLVVLKTLSADALPSAQRVLDWAVNHLYDTRGFFYYRQLRFLKIRTSYMRWSQAWMVLALATLISDSVNER